MATLERLSPAPTVDEDSRSGPEFVPLSEAGSMLDRLSTEVPRSIVSELGVEPATTSTLAERTGTSVQNVGYHLSRLQEAGLVTVVGTRYSEKGREMNVYAPASESFVIYFGSSARDREEGISAREEGPSADSAAAGEGG